MDKKKINILVFPCGTELGLEIYQALRYEKFFYLIGGNSVKDHGCYVYENYIDDIPFYYEKNFIQYFTELIKERGIDFVYPTMDIVQLILKKNEKCIGCKIVAPSLQTVETCVSKEKTYKKLRNIVYVPQLISYGENVNIEFPVFVKPKIGYGARGAKRVDNFDELRLELKKRNDLLIMEYLPGEEYTIDCFTDRYGNLKYCNARVRKRIRAGISVNTFFIKNQSEHIEIAKKINSCISMRGGWFIQVKKDGNGKLCLMEVASRIGGASTLSRAIGVNLPLLTLFDLMGQDIRIIENSFDVELDRAFGNNFKLKVTYNTVFVDYDDCIMIDDTLNVELIAFLFWASEKRKQLILLT